MQRRLQFKSQCKWQSGSICQVIIKSSISAVARPNELVDTTMFQSTAIRQEEGPAGFDNLSEYAYQRESNNHHNEFNIISIDNLAGQYGNYAKINDQDGSMMACALDDKESINSFEFSSPA